jgi:hypothetical protein
VRVGDLKAEHILLCLWLPFFIHGLPINLVYLLLHRLHDTTHCNSFLAFCGSGIEICLLYITLILDRQIVDMVVKFLYLVSHAYYLHICLYTNLVLRRLIPICMAMEEVEHSFARILDTCLGIHNEYRQHPSALLLNSSFDILLFSHLFQTSASAASSIFLWTSDSSVQMNFFGSVTTSSTSELSSCSGS